DGLEDVRCGHAVIQRNWFSRVVCVAAAPSIPATEPNWVGGGHERSRLQHSGELCDQHQLAGLRWRDHTELSDSNARADRAEFCVSRDRHGCSRRPHPRLDPAQLNDAWEFLERFGSQHTLYSFATGVLVLPRARIAGSGPNV